MLFVSFLVKEKRSVFVEAENNQSCFEHKNAFFVSFVLINILIDWGKIFTVKRKKIRS